MHKHAHVSCIHKSMCMHIKRPALARGPRSFLPGRPRGRANGFFLRFFRNCVAQASRSWGRNPVAHSVISMAPQLGSETRGRVQNRKRIGTIRDSLKSMFRRVLQTPFAYCHNTALGSSKNSNSNTTHSRQFLRGIQLQTHNARTRLHKSQKPSERTLLSNAETAVEPMKQH